MNSEILSPLSFKHLESINDLLFCKAVLGISRIIHNGITYLKESAGIKTAADGLRNANQLVQHLNMGKIIQINGSPDLFGVNEFVVRSSI